MARKIIEIEQEAKAWLKNQLKHEQFVFAKSDLDRSIYLYLEQKQLLAELNKQYVFIKSDSEFAIDAFKNNLWILLLQFLNLAFDEAWYFNGYYAYQFAVENFSNKESQITVLTRNKSNTMIELPADIKIIATYDKDYDDKPLQVKKFFNVKYYELKPELLIIKSTENEYRTYKNEIVALLKSNTRDEEFILKYFQNHSQPVLLARLIGALKALDDFGLRIELEKQLKLSEAKVSIKNPFGEVTLSESRERPVYLNRLELSMQKAIDTLANISKPKRLSKKLGIKDLEKIVTEDTYHSLTIEGYTVTRALIEYLKDESHTVQDEKFATDLKNQLAAKGFMNALAYIKELNKQTYTITEQVSSKLFQELWKPSVNANLIKSNLDIYRKHMVAIKGAQYVPPSHDKVPFMIDEVFDYARKITNGFELGIFLHFFYVGVHPHSDGNGRISRFLLNLAFIQDKYKWLTIPSEDRKNYFAALERSQLEDDINYFAEYIRSKY